MIQLKTLLNVIDNTGAIIAECIRVGHGGRYGRIGKNNDRVYSFIRIFDSSKFLSSILSNIR
jgi:ribosomal protein L14